MEYTVVILSGGLDSTTLLYDVAAHNHSVVHAIGFNYGQRHKKELTFAQATCDNLGVPFSVIDLHASGFTNLIVASNSSLVDMDIDVPEGHYAEENMSATIVPNRNMVMMAIAGSIAVAKKASWIAIGTHAGDHFIYPDCRSEFTKAAARALYVGNEGSTLKGIIAPYQDMTKAKIARRALELGVPLNMTWSCYKGGDIHCGRCGTCVERLEAIDAARLTMQDEDLIVPEDTTLYADTEYWKQAVANANR